MIEPVVFPFTYLDARAAGMLLSCFNRLRVYIPTDSVRDEFAPEVLENGLIDVRNPVSDNGSQVDQVFREYRQWRQANMGTDISFFRSRDNNIPFFNEDTISFLRQDILQTVPGASENTADLLLAARVFLRITGSYDRIQSEIEESLVFQNEKELSMLAALQGEDNAEDDNDMTISATTGLSADAGELMIAERLKSWSMLAAEDDSPSALYTTTSRSALAVVTDRFEDRCVVFEDIPVPGDAQKGDLPACEDWQNGLDVFLAGLLQGDVADGENTSMPEYIFDGMGAFLTIVCLPGVSPRYFLENLCQSPLESRRNGISNESASTIVTAVFPA